MELFVPKVVRLFNEAIYTILQGEKMPWEWRSVLVPVCKNKGHVQICSKYRGIKLMRNVM